YEQAIELIKGRIEKPKFYVFTDDSKWVEENLNINGTIISGYVTKTYLEDFHLMSCCKHNIIANSSFSWWAAWLNNNPGKIVISPLRWFNEANKNVADLIPERWIRL